MEKYSEKSIKNQLEAYYKEYSSEEGNLDGMITDLCAYLNSEGDHRSFITSNLEDNKKIDIKDKTGLWNAISQPDGGFYNFLRFVKEYNKNHTDKKHEQLALCFRNAGNNAIEIYWNNHVIWKLTISTSKKHGTWYKVGFNYDHARRDSEWVRHLSELNTLSKTLSVKCNKNIDKFKLEKIETEKIPAGGIGEIKFETEKQYSYTFVEKTFQIFKSVQESYACESPVEDYFRKYVVHEWERAGNHIQDKEGILKKYIKKNPLPEKNGNRDSLMNGSLRKY